MKTCRTRLQHVLGENASNVIRTCPFEVLLKFSKRLEDVMKTCCTSSICNAFGVTDTSSRRVR